MNIAIAPAHRAFDRAKVSARNIDKWFAERRASGLVANERGKNIAFLQKQTTGDTDCFLPTADINTAGDQAAAIETDQFILEGARQQHPTKRFEKSFVRRF